MSPELPRTMSVVMQLRRTSRADGFREGVARQVKTGLPGLR